MNTIRQICPDLPTFLHELRWNAAAVIDHGVLWATYIDTAHVRHLVAAARVALPTCGLVADTLSLELDLPCGLNSVFARVAVRRERAALAAACAEWAPLALRAASATQPARAAGGITNITREIILDRAEAQV